MTYAAIPWDERETDDVAQRFAPKWPLAKRTSFGSFLGRYFYMTIVVLGLLTLFLCALARNFRIHVELIEAIQNSCSIDPSIVHTLGLPATFEYARLEIDPNFHAQHEDSFEYPKRTFAPLDASLPRFQTFTSDELATSSSMLNGSSCASLSINAPIPNPRGDGSHIIFGVATNLARLDASLDNFAFWAASTGAQMIVVVPVEEIAGTAQKIRNRARTLDVNLVIVESRIPNHEDQYFSLVKEMHQRRTSKTQWTVVIDDDFFLFSMHALVRYLQRYDPSKPWYIGGLTEDFHQMHVYGFMAYGGGGVFLSVPLLEQLNQPAVYQACFDSKAIGDGQIANCIYAHTLVKMTPEPLLHQMDLGGDVSGFYESGRTLPLSVHHWKSWYTMNMTALVSVASVCGPECLLRRWRLADADAAEENPWYLTNGYSLVQYGEELREDDISMEHTWDAQSDFKYSLDPLREKDEKKVSLKMDVTWAEDGGSVVRQFYMGKVEGDRTRVLEVVWRKGVA